MKTYKIAFTSLVFCVSLPVMAAVDPGTYTDQTITDNSFSNPTGDAVWVFENSTFANNVNFSITGGSADSSYLIQLKSSSMTFSSYTLGRNAAGSTTVFELIGTQSARSSLTGTNTDWNFWLNASSNANNASNELRLNGYSDFTANNFKITSDSGPVSGSAGVVISGADNTFTSLKNVFINYNGHSSDHHLYFNISGAEGAKSVANFGQSFTVRAAGAGLTEINMKGNADFTVASEFNLARDASNGKATFSISGSNNTFTNNHSANGFFIGGNMKGGEGIFTVGGKNNTVLVKGNAYLGSDVAGNTGTSVFAIEGSGHSVTFEKALIVRVSGSSDKAVLRFAADADGMSTLNVGSITGFGGDLEIDLTDFVGDETGFYSIALISAAGNWSSIASQFEGSSSESAANVTMGGNGVDWDMVYDNGKLILNYSYSQIPEPAVYAAMFGALALAFAAYRRRK